MIFLDRLWSIRSRVRRVRRLVIEVIIIVKYHALLETPVIEVITVVEYY